MKKKKKIISLLIMTFLATLLSFGAVTFPVQNVVAEDITSDGIPNIYANDTSLPSADAVDVASYQSWMTQNDFNQLAAQGVRTAIVKLTEGTWYDNPYAQNQITYAKNAGLNVAAYHYLELGDAQDQTTANAQAALEAQKFVNAASYYGLGSSTVMALDIESNGVNTSKVSWTQAVQVFANKLASVGYTNIRYYTSINWIKFGYVNPSVLGNQNMWIAQYLTTKPNASDLQNTQYGAWQYSSRMYFQNMSQSKPLDVSIDYGNIFGGGTGPHVYGPHGSVFRLYNPNTGEHFYTESTYEANADVKAGWNYEGIGWTAPDAGNQVFRLYNPNAGDHFYTLYPYERDQLVAAGWKFEGAVFLSGGSTPLYRAYNPNATAGAHNYTISPFEQQNLVSKGWRNEGVAWYGK